MNKNRAAARTARANLRNLVRANRAAARARRQVATGTPQTARTHLVAAGLSDADAKRYAGAFSRSVIATDTVRATMRNPKGKRRGSRKMRVAVKVYDVATFRARLAAYRPKAADAAARFEALAA